MLRRLRQSLFAKLTLAVLVAAVTVIIILVLAIGEAIRAPPPSMRPRRDSACASVTGGRAFLTPPTTRCPRLMECAAIGMRTEARAAAGFSWILKTARSI
ncbi:MAG: hypothetical protein OXU96_06140 [Gammaproteobacteria bacterium]|nr:hypothetical protein [Gammaproteobacteria bacterium]